MTFPPVPTPLLLSLKALWIHDQEKMMVTMVVMEEVVLLVVLLVEVLVKKRQLRVQAAVLVETYCTLAGSALIFPSKFRLHPN